MENKFPDHAPTVKIEDGKMTVTGQVNVLKERKGVRVMPDPNEEISPLWENRHLFANLEFADILLTNACNLSCHYCYEQHNKDYGRFTPQSIRRVWDWLRDVNDNFPKYIQFFGGEPLIHKNLILAFMKENADELLASKDKMAVSITTNGLLLTKEFVDEFFQYPNVKMMISLDTIDASLDHRGIGQEKIDKLLDMIEYVASVCPHPDKLAIRATITRDGSKHLLTLWEELYRRGVRQLIFHPLILSLGQGYVEWPEEEWQQFSTDIQSIIRTYPDVEHVQVVEGVGAKSKTNCLIGGDEIAIDASGDFSGCYFFTNRKSDQSGKMLLGNVFTDELYMDRYRDLTKQYADLYDHEECQTCSVKNLCYQCPAGNQATSGKLFRPDGMCKKIVTLYSDVNELLMERKFINKINSMKEAVALEGDVVLSRALVHLIHYFLEDEKADTQVVNQLLTHYLEPDKLIGWWQHIIEWADRPDTVKEKTYTPEVILEEARAYNTSGDFPALYHTVRACEGLPPSDKAPSLIEGITALHFTVMNVSESRKRQ